MIPRIRTVKPELLSHENLFDAEIKYQLPLRLAFIGLFTCCDREGRFRWQPRRLKLSILPYDEVDFSRVLDIFWQEGYIKKYVYQGEYYGCIPSWLRHQYINSREAESELPSIEGSEVLALDTFDDGSCQNNALAFDTATLEVCVTREARVDDASRACTRGREGNGTEGKGKEGNRSLVASGTRSSSFDSLQQVFEYWKSVMDHPNAKLDDKRKGIIKKALSSGYSVQQLCGAIKGCSLTPHNMGDNERGQRYDGLQVILRDGDQIDRFMRNCQQPPRVRTEPERRTETNIHTLQRWVNQKMQEEEIHASA